MHQSASAPGAIPDVNPWPIPRIAAVALLGVAVVGVAGWLIKDWLAGR